MVIMNYKERIDRVISFIGTNLDKDLTIDELCKVACFSEYHFHRLLLHIAIHPYKTILSG